MSLFVGVKATQRCGEDLQKRSPAIEMAGPSRGAWSSAVEVARLLKLTLKLIWKFT